LVDYTKAIEINPNDADAFDKRGYCYSLTDQWQKAIDDYQAALAIKPNEPDTVARLRFAQRQIAPPPVAASTPKPTPEPTPVPPLISPTGWIGIGAGAVVLLLIIVVFVVRARRRSPD
jgi:tetratricopeptide (TPR) repeat protein